MAAVLPPPAPGCASCAARDAVIAEQARVLCGQDGVDQIELELPAKSTRSPQRRAARRAASHRRLWTGPAALRTRRSGPACGGVEEDGEGPPVADHRIGQHPPGPARWV